LAYTSTGQRAASLLYTEYTQVVWRHNSPDSAPLCVMSSRSSHFCAADDNSLRCAKRWSRVAHSILWILIEEAAFSIAFISGTLWWSSWNDAPGCAWAGSLFGLCATTIEYRDLASLHPIPHFIHLLLFVRPKTDDLVSLVRGGPRAHLGASQCPPRPWPGPFKLDPGLSPAP
jgi:hypothetical protein